MNGDKTLDTSKAAHAYLSTSLPSNCICSGSCHIYDKKMPRVYDTLCNHIAIAGLNYDRLLLLLLLFDALVFHEAGNNKKVFTATFKVYILNVTAVFIRDVIMFFLITRIIKCQCCNCYQLLQSRLYSVFLH